MKDVVAAAATGLALLSATAVHASIVNYDYKGTGSVTFNGTYYNNVSFDVSAVGLTKYVAPLPHPPYLAGTFYNLVLTTINVSGIGLLTESDLGYVFNVESASFGGFGSSSRADFVYFGGNSQLASYDLSKSIGPLAVVGGVPGHQSVQTTSGLLTFNSVGSGVFTSVIAAPEPGTWALFLLGVGAVGGVLRTGRRKKAASRVLA